MGIIISPNDSIFMGNNDRNVTIQFTTAGALYIEDQFRDGERIASKFHYTIDENGISYNNDAGQTVTFYNSNNPPTKADVGLDNINNWGASSDINANSMSQYATTNLVAKVRNECAPLTILEKIYPVGSIYMSAVSTNPTTLFGFGTWSRIAQGRAIVGVDESNASYSTPLKTGGASQVTHNHWTGTGWDGNGFFIAHYNVLPRTRTITVYNTFVEEAGSTKVMRQNSTYDETISTVQPYITVYVWRRTA